MAYRILLVDNDANLRSDYRRNLTLWGYDVVEAEGKGDELLANAREKGRQPGIDLMLADQHLLDDNDLGDRSGIALAEDLAPLPCIIVTNHGTPKDIRYALKHKVVLDYLYGPWGPQALREALEAVLEDIEGRRLESFRAWAVLVGVNQYQDGDINNLAFCVADVTAVHQLLQPDYEAVKLLTDACEECPPTRANILSELAAVSEAAEAEDLLLFYFCGHGIAKDGESYLLPCDARRMVPTFTGISVRDIREIMERSAARRRVIVLDACYSGARMSRTGTDMSQEFIQHVFENAEGIAVLAACAQDQVTMESEEKGMGVFTYYLLEALRGAADMENKGFVTVHDVNLYVASRVRHWAFKNGKPLFTPTLQLAGVGDIVLRLLRRPAVTA